MDEVKYLKKKKRRKKEKKRMNEGRLCVQNRIVKPVTEHEFLLKIVSSSQQLYRSQTITVCLYSTLLFYFIFYKFLLQQSRSSSSSSIYKDATNNRRRRTKESKEKPLKCIRAREQRGPAAVPFKKKIKINKNKNTTITLKGDEYILRLRTHSTIAARQQQDMQ